MSILVTTRRIKVPGGGENIHAKEVPGQEWNLGGRPPFSRNFSNYSRGRAILNFQGWLPGTRDCHGWPPRKKHRFQLARKNSYKKE